MANYRLNPSLFSTRYLHLRELKKHTLQLLEKYNTKKKESLLLDFGCGDMPYREVIRSDERREGKEGVSKCRSRWSYELCICDWSSDVCSSYLCELSRNVSSFQEGCGELRDFAILHPWPITV